MFDLKECVLPSISDYRHRQLQFLPSRDLIESIQPSHQSIESDRNMSTLDLQALLTSLVACVVVVLVRAAQVGCKYVLMYT